MSFDRELRRLRAECNKQAIQLVEVKNEVCALRYELQVQKDLVSLTRQQAVHSLENERTSHEQREAILRCELQAQKDVVSLTQQQAVHSLAAERWNHEQREGETERRRHIFMGEKLAEAKQACEKATKANESRTRRRQSRKRHDAMMRMCKQFGWENAGGQNKEYGWAARLTGRLKRSDDDLMGAALGFWMGAQNGLGCVQRMELLYDVVKYGFKGRLWETIFAEVKASQRANPIHIARAQDIESSFNGRALQGIRFYLPGVKVRVRNKISLSMDPNFLSVNK